MSLGILILLLLLGLWFTIAIHWNFYEYKLPSAANFPELPFNFKGVFCQHTQMTTCTACTSVFLHMFNHINILPVTVLYS